MKGYTEAAEKYFRSPVARKTVDELAEGRRRASEVLEELDVAWLEDLDPRLFANANDPATYRALLDALR